VDLSRRHLLQLGMFSAAGVALTACGDDSGSGSTDSKTTTLWYWAGGLSDKVVADGVTHFSQTTLKPSVIGGDFKAKLTTTIASGKFVPDITGVKGEDMAAFLPQASKFVDLNTLGASKVTSEYLTWKLQKGTTQDGKLVGFPIDIGPTAMFYREDLFAQAGLPTEPAAVGTAVATWDGYFALGQELKGKLPKTFLINNSGSIFGMVVGQGTTRFIDDQNHFIGDQDHVRSAWDTAVRSVTLGINAKINDDSWNAAIGNGALGTEIGAAWHALDISSAAPDTKGKWRVAANPGGPSNIGGSFLAIPKAAANPELAFEIVTWLLSPENQARGFTDAALFPSAPAAYKLPALTGGDPFFGGQATIDVFGPAAEKIPVSFEAPQDAAVSAPYYTELTNVEAKGKKPEDAWKDAVNEAKSIAERQGVN
jgi:cellobiose transport system substrate-binding protein